MVKTERDSTAITNDQSTPKTDRKTFLDAYAGLKPQFAGGSDQPKEPDSLTFDDAFQPRKSKNDPGFKAPDGNNSGTDRGFYVEGQQRLDAGKASEILNKQRESEQLKTKKPFPDAYTPSGQITSSDIFHEGISSSGVRQGKYGDCFFLSPLASMADTPAGNQAIRDMIKSNPDGSFTVTFPGDKDHPVTVTNSEIANYGLRSDEADWAKVMEAGFLKYNKNGAVPTPDKAMHLLTNKDTFNDQSGFDNNSDGRPTHGSTNPANLRQDLINAFQRNDIVTAATTSNAGDQHHPGNLVSDHDYSVLGFDPKTNTVTVRNPWGTSGVNALKNPGDTDQGVTYQGNGVMTMSLDTFYAKYNSVDIAGENAVLAHASHLANDTSSAAADLLSGTSHMASFQPVDAVQDFEHYVGSLWSFANDTVNAFS